MKILYTFYDVKAEQWSNYHKECSKIGEAGTRRFMYTSCPKDSVKWNCGKNCTKTNSTQIE